jgi:two-component system OmpR family response regulator
MENTISIIVVDDDQNIRVLLKEYLSKQNYNVSMAENGNELHNLLKQKPYDLILLDIMLPGTDGITLCQELRKDYKTPIIMLTAVNTDSDRIISLEFGADDYLAKPFNPRELVARIKAVLRRTKGNEAQHEKKKQASLYEFAGWTLNISAHRLIAPDQAEVALSTASYSLLIAFLESPQRVLTRDYLLTNTKNRMSEPFDRSIDVQVSRLRQKIEEDPKNPQIFKTIQGAGYLFTPSVIKR